MIAVGVSAKPTDLCYTSQDDALRGFSRKEVAAMLGVDPKTVSREIRRGNLRAFRVGRAVRISRKALVDYMDRGSEE